MRGPSPARLIGVNIVADAFGTAVFIAGTGFFAVGLAGAEPALVLNCLTIGTLAGVGLSFFAASLADTLGARNVLLSIQAVQFAAYFGMLLTRSVPAILILCAAGAGLSRLTAPVRGTLPPSYLDKPQLLEFKSVVKVWTVAAAIAGGAAAAALGLIGTSAALLAIPGLNCLSFVAAFALTAMLPKHRGESGTGRKRLSVYRPSADVLLASVFFAFLFALGNIPESAVAVLAAEDRALPSVVVAIAPLTAFAVAVAGQRILKNRNEFLRVRARQILLGAMVSEAAAMVLLGVVTKANLDGAAAVALIAAVGVLAEAGLLAATYCLWDLQYSIGSDADRGGIIGTFTIANAIGLALSPALASFYFFRELAVPVVAGALGVTLIVGAALSLALRRRDPDALVPHV